MIKIDDILQNMDQTLCEQLMPKEQSCSTPLNPGIYGEIKPPLLFMILQNNNFLAHFILSIQPES